MTTAAAEDRERVGPYRVIRAIGAGGSARIDLARIERAYGFQRHVVIKRPLEHLRGNPQVAASLRREARIGGRLRHPNLVAILDAGIHDGYDYLALEYVHGSALRSVMQSDAPGRVRELPLAVVLAIVCDVARGMHEAHELTDDHGSPLGLVHRDVSPGNILVGFDGSVKLADFGIAKETRVSTLSGSMHGTVTYMAPEQCQGHAFDRRADVFSLGVILYELVTGTRLFWADNDVASLHRVLSGSVPRPRKVKPQLAAVLEDIVMTAVAHDADKRYPTALELATALELHAAGAGEILGARWIARAIEDIVGPRQAPWIATAVASETAAATETTPRGDGSLVELIAAGPDEPLEASFGDGNGDGDAAADEPADRSDRAALPPAQRAPRRARKLVAGAVAFAVIGGAAAATLVVTRRADAPSTSAPTTFVAPSETPAPPSSARPTASPAAPASAGPTANPAAPASAGPTAGPAEPPRAPEAAPVATSPESVETAPSPAVSTTAKKRRRTQPPSRTAPSTPLPRTAVPSSAAHGAAEASAAKASAAKASAARAGDRDAEPPANHAASAVRDPGAGSAQTDVPPPRVQWKPTLLLPTDGSGARNPK